MYPLYQISFTQHVIKSFEKLTIETKLIGINGVKKEDKCEIQKTFKTF